MRSNMFAICSVAVVSEDARPPAVLESGHHRIEEGYFLHTPRSERALCEGVFSGKNIQHMAAGRRHDRLRGASREFEVLRGASDVATIARSVLRPDLSAAAREYVCLCACRFALFAYSFEYLSPRP